MAGLEARSAQHHVHAMTDRLENTMATKKDLPAKKDVKGGRKQA